MSLNDHNVEILLAALKERYDAIHAIRKRTQDVCVSSLGILFGFSGWLVQSGVVLDLVHKIIYVISILASFMVLRFLYLADLQRGFRNQQRVAVRIEKTLRLFSVGAFDDAKEAIYPENWQHAGTRVGPGKFYHSTYALLYLGTVLLIATILLKGCVL
jgi:hypothetical protein